MSSILLFWVFVYFCFVFACDFWFVVVNVSVVLLVDCACCLVLLYCVVFGLLVSGAGCWLKVVCLNVFSCVD